MKKLLLIIVLMFLILSVPCIAIRVSGKNVVNFEPNLEKSFNLCTTIIAYGKEAHYSVVEGPLSEYVTVQDKVIEYDKPDTLCTRYTLKLPSEVDVYGKQRVYIKVQEINPNPEEGVFKVVPTMKHPLEIIIPFPGKLITGTFAVSNVKEGEVLPIVLELFSKGKNSVESADTLITLYDINNNSIASLRPPVVYDLIPGNSTKMELGWNTTRQKSGTYRANAKVSYGNKTLDLEKVFHIGSLNVEILDHTKNMTNGSIKPVEVTVQSKWTDPIGEVYADITINGKTAKTPHQKIQPWNPTKLMGFIDATNFQVGETDLIVTVYYSGKKTEYNGKINIIPHPIEKKGFDIDISTTTILIMAIALLAALNIVWFIFYRRRKNKNKINDHAHQVTLDEVGFKNEKK